MERGDGRAVSSFRVGINCLTSPCGVHTNRGDLPGQNQSFLKSSALNMKRVVAAFGVCAVGVTSLQGQNVTGLSSKEAKKSWNVSASLRGFYDDNSLNQTKENAEPSFGTEFSPEFSVNLPLERTLFTASYKFTLNYYEARPD